MISRPFPPKSFRLLQSDYHFAIQPVHNDDHSSRVASLIVERDSGKVNFKYGKRLDPSDTREIYAVAGVVNLPVSSYLVVVTSRKQVSRLHSLHDIYVVRRLLFLPIGPERANGLDSGDDEFIAGIRRIYETGMVYFCYTLDLSQSLARLCSDASDRIDASKYDHRFLWNRSMLAPLIQLGHKLGGTDEREIHLFCIPFICGVIRSIRCNIGTNPFSYVLISRKSSHRAGTRYHSRGIDTDGNVANFVETEQIVSRDAKRDSPEQYNQLPPDNHLLSWVTLRGSIPLFWRQMITSRYVPDLAIEHPPNEKESMKKHFDALLKSYGGKIVAVNLVNAAKYEGRLEVAFRNAVDQMQHPDVRYVFFDFHNECRNMQWQNISKLLSTLREELDDGSMLELKTPNEGGGLSVALKPISRQSGAIRTNCMDCLDRTNVVQSVLARHILRTMLDRLQILPEGKDIQDYDDFNRQFMNVWADNADSISILYSGTPALKTDFTRTGKRTVAGNLQDLRSSIVRYVLNNYFDGLRQDTYDLLHNVAEYHTAVTPAMIARGFDETAERAKKVLERRPRHLKISLSLSLIGYMVIALVSQCYLRDIWMHAKLAILYIPLVVAGFSFYLRAYGRDIVDRPRLKRAA